MTELSDYADKYHCINFSRSDGVLEMTMHSRGGPAKWGTSLKSLHAELGHAFMDVARDYENKVVILTGTGDSFISEMDPEEPFPEPSLAHMWPRIQDEGLALLNNHIMRVRCEEMVDEIERTVALIEQDIQVAP